MSDNTNDFETTFNDGAAPAGPTAAEQMRAERETREAAAVGEFTSAFDAEPDAGNAATATDAAATAETKDKQ